jgi:hypothetical protein
MIKRKTPKVHIEIDLTGPEGNAFNLLGLASKLAKQFDLDAEIIHKEMIAGDYENLVQVFDRYFGTMVILYR